MHKAKQIAKAIDKINLSSSEQKRIQALAVLSVWLDGDKKEIEEREAWCLSKLEFVLK